MNSGTFKAIFEHAKEWTLEAGRQLRETLQDQIVVEYKTSAADLVTEKDKAIEQFFVERINEFYPKHFILGEEGIASGQEFQPEKETVWIIDPIDGTTNFVHQKKDFSISIGIFVKGTPMIGIIYDPIQDECFYAQKGEGAYHNGKKLPLLSETTVEESVLGINALWLTSNEIFDHARFQSLVRHARAVRSVGSAALELAYVACGRFDGSVSLRLSPWDYAGGVAILEEVGAKVTTIDNQPLSISAKRTTVFAASPKLHQEIMENFLLSSDIPKYSLKV
ncbi:inositol monophosphatase family protein [Bacillus horti]|uniref:inositol-phosphate phosphatase n=1 Tax=Caldalkalibacillus horti TaxID=77523 RepID=A0ABT9W117_9BACI|nr:inositol monophosphatase family protein [Bacillus horti]MDQ0166932.1 myo-inositol-1(or 4)-monophosphatase [Bacillus horti]